MISTFFSNRAQSWFLNSKILFVFGNRSRARSKDYYIFFRSNSGLVFKLKHSIPVQKSISSAIQRILIFFQIELWVRYFVVFRSSSELVSKFKNSVLVQKSIESATQRLLILFRLSSGFVIFFVFRSSSELVSKFKNSVLVQKSIKSAIQRLLILFRLSYGLISTFFSNRAQSWFLNSKILFVFGNRSRARSKDY